MCVLKQRRLEELTGPHEDQVFRNDALTHDECPMFVIICNACMGHMEQTIITPVTLS